MYQRMLMDGKPYPEYIVHADAVQLTLRSTMENERFIRFVVEEQDKCQMTFDLSKLMLLRYLMDHKRITIALGAKVIQGSKDSALASLEKLRELTLVESSGREYMLTPRVYETLKKDVAYIQDKTVQQLKGKGLIIEYCREKGTINRSKVQELCGYSKDQATYLLKKMCNDNVLERLGRGRSTEYRLKA